LIEQLFYKSNEPLKAFIDFFFFVCFFFHTAIHSLLWLIVLYTLTLKKSCW